MFYAAFLPLIVRFVYCEEGEWSYHGENGTSKWPELFPEYCSEEYNNRQSPIDISNTVCDPNLGPIAPEGYEKTLTDSTITNNGHTIQIVPNNSEKYYISGGVNQDKFVLENIHIHWRCHGFLECQGSEHTVDGKRFPAEIHMVHRNTRYGTMDEALKYEDGLAVLAVFCSDYCDSRLDCLSPLGYVQDNPAMSSITKALKEVQYADTTANFNLGVSLSSLLPSDGCESFCRYNGSLTTPACNPSVIWTICKQRIQCKQLCKFCNVYKTKRGEPIQYLKDNVRPLQERNGRTILCSQPCNH